MPRRSGTARLARCLGERIRSLRTEIELTQERLAWDCDLDKGYLSQVEAGKRLPSLAVLAAIAARLGVVMADILAFDLGNPRLKLLDAARRKDRSAARKAMLELGIG